VGYKKMLMQAAEPILLTRVLIRLRSAVSIGL